MDHYNTLGVDKSAAQDDIKKAYRKLASQHHPDKGGDTAQFQKIQSAYETLSDPNKRAEYDNPRPTMGAPGGFPGGFGFTSTGGNPFGDIFEQMFRQQAAQRQQVFRTTVWVTLEQVYSGGEQVLQLQTQTGTSAVTISIPKGIPDGGQVRLDNIINGAALLVEFRTHRHLKYERQGNDLVCNHQISVLDLIVGTTFEFQALSGKTLEVTIPPKTQPFQQMKIAGYGMPINGTTAMGDQIILLKPFTPAIIDESITNSILQSRVK